MKKMMKRKRNQEIDYHASGGGRRSEESLDAGSVIFIVLGAAFIGAVAYFTFRKKADADDDNGNGDIPPATLQSQLSSIWSVIDFPIWAYRGNDPVPADDADDWWGYDPDGVISGYPELTELLAGDYVALMVTASRTITTPTSGTVSLVPGEYNLFDW